MAGGTAIVLDERMLAHDPGAGHPERAGSPARAARPAARTRRGLVRVGARPAAATTSSRSCTRPRWSSRSRRRRGARAGALRSRHARRRPGRARRRASRRAACSSCATRCCAGEVDNGVRARAPAGSSRRVRGARWASASSTTSRSRPRISGAAASARVAIVDWDLHHGNGTQHIFEDDPDVLYVSTHQYPYYPGTGAAEEVGRGRRRRAHAQPAVPRRLRRRRVRARLRRGDHAGAAGSSPRSSCWSRPASTATCAIRSAASP